MGFMDYTHPTKSTTEGLGAGRSLEFSARPGSVGDMNGPLMEWSGTPEGAGIGAAHCIPNVAICSNDSAIQSLACMGPSKRHHYLLKQGRAQFWCSLVLFKIYLSCLFCMIEIIY